MASFGRRPAKGVLGGSTLNKGSSGRDSYRRLKEEEAERERFAKEFEERGTNTRSSASKPRDEHCKAASPPRREANPRVFLVIEVRGPELLGRPGRLEASGRLEFELRADCVPKTAKNFECLCTGERGSTLSFDQSVFHRIIPGFMAQGGDITDGDGTGGKSIYGKEFADESFRLRHEAAGTLSMANSGKNTNNSQFFILFKATPHLDGKHVVFGNLLKDDAKILRKIEERGTKSGDVKGTVVITQCGEIHRKQDCLRQGEKHRSRSRKRSRSQKSAGRHTRGRARSASASPASSDRGGRRKESSL